ncbi:MAG TPA: hypothetical protein VH601_02030 [Bryobacteraceae bacterium]|jgi:hypothetical protein
MDSVSLTVDQPTGDIDPTRGGRTGVFFVAAVILIAATLLVYSQTMSFVWDEGFHLIAAQLINSGKTPYIDFCFPQTLLNAYWNAGLMRFFGDNWRVTHFAAALFVIGAVFLMANFVLRRFPVPHWQLACGIAVACMIGLDIIVMQFGTVAQAYGMGLFFTVAAFRAAVAAIERRTPFLAFAAGLFAGAAASATLLAAAGLPVLLVWIWFYSRAGQRCAKASAFIAGGLIPFIPAFWLFVKAPRQTFFNVIQYQAMFRRVNWGQATLHDIGVLSDWLNSTQALLMGVLAITGAWFVWRRSAWNRERRAEFYLAAWLSLVPGLYIAAAHPTFGRYFIFLIPFMSVLAAVGIYVVGSKLGSPTRSFWPAALVTTLFVLCLGKALYEDRESVRWKDYEQIAQKIKEVTPANGLFMADELVYFLLRQTPPPGMEFSYSHKLQLLPDQERLYHIISETELKRDVQAGRFYTVETCRDEIIESFKLDEIFPNSVDIADCTVYWGKVKGSAASLTK